MLRGVLATRTTTRVRPFPVASASDSSTSRTPLFYSHVQIARDLLAKSKLLNKKWLPE